MVKIIRRLFVLTLCAAVLFGIIKTVFANGSVLDSTTDAAFFSALLAMPEGGAATAAARFQDANENDIPYETDPEIEFEHSPSSLVGSSAKDSESSVAPLPENASGRILSRFLSPYTAGLNYDGIYMRNSTSKDIDIKAELSSGIKWKMALTKDPEVLILHTHTTEGYMSEDRDFYTPGDATHSENQNESVVRVGTEIESQLASAGISVIHDKKFHDKDSYTGSYSRSEETVKSYLAKYPSIKVVIDVHRDSVSSGEKDKVKPVVEVGGKKSAQVMLVMGCEDGKVTGHPNWRENLRLALLIQQKYEKTYPGLARPIYFAPKKYNENLTTGSMILEVGTEANSLDEAVYAGQLSGKVIADVLKTLKK